MEVSAGGRKCRLGRGQIGIERALNRGQHPRSRRGHFTDSRPPAPTNWRSGKRGSERAALSPTAHHSLHHSSFLPPVCRRHHSAWRSLPPPPPQPAPLRHVVHSGSGLARPVPCKSGLSQNNLARRAFAPPTRSAKVPLAPCPASSPLCRTFCSPPADAMQYSPYLNGAAGSQVRMCGRGARGRERKRESGSLPFARPYPRLRAPRPSKPAPAPFLAHNQGYSGCCRPPWSGP